MSHYSREFIELQVDFARRVAELETISLATSLLRYSSAYKMIGIEDWSFIEDNPQWHSFLVAIEQGADPAQEIYKLASIQPEPKRINAFGCFSYEYEEKENYIQVHFANVVTTPYGPLATEAQFDRTDELKRLFSDVKERYPQATHVSGFSWLYNIEPYRRLFPEAYLLTAKPNFDWFRSSALWGQFLDSERKLKKEVVATFRETMREAKTATELKKIFPYPLLELFCPIGEFYKFFRIP